MYDNHSLFGYSQIITVVSQNATTLVVTVDTGNGSLFAINQQVSIWPAKPAQPLFSNAMVGRLTSKTGDQLTIDITSANREGSNVRTVLVGDQIANTITPKALTDIEDAIPGFVTNETPGGQINNSNMIFTTANAYSAGTTRLFLNGQRQQLANDYVESGAQQVTFTTAPQVGDILIIDYQKT